MKINFVSDYPITDDFVEVVAHLAKTEYPGEVTGLRELSPGDEPDGPVVCLGKPEWEGTCTQGPSVKQVLKTSGGVTQLTRTIDLALARQDFEVLRPGAYIHCVQSHEARDALGPLLEEKYVVVDIEVAGDINEDVPSAEAMLMIGFYAPGYMPVVLSGDALDPDADYIVKMFSGDNPYLIMHNGKFDAKWLSLWFGETIYCDIDTMLMHYAMFPGTGEHGLKPVCERIFGIGDWDAPLKQYTKGKKGYENIPIDILAYYNAQDVFYTWALYEYLERRKSQQERDLINTLLMPAASFLQQVEENGIAIDIPYLHEYGDVLRERRDAALSRLQAIAADVDFRTPAEIAKGKIKQEDKLLNPASPAQIKKYFTARTGSVPASTNEPTILKMQAKGIEEEFIGTLLEYRGLAKQIGTYVDGLLNRERDGRVYSTYKLHGTITGRLSSSNPNVQNIPRDTEIRRAFISPRSVDEEKSGVAGDRYRVLVGCDYSQAELRTMAELSQDEAMIAAFQEDAPDFFDALMPSAYPGLTEEYFDHAHPGYKELRAKIKGVVYGMSYGRKAKAIAEALEMPVFEAVQIIEGYLGRFPKFAQWRESIMPRVLEGTLITPFGRRFQQDVVSGAQLVSIENSALSFLPQSTASDICLTAAMDLQREMHTFSDAMIVALVHDAITVECWNTEAEEMLELMQLRMRQSATRVFSKVPFLTDGKIDTRWDKV